MRRGRNSFLLRGWEAMRLSGYRVEQIPRIRMIPVPEVAEEMPLHGKVKMKMLDMVVTILLAASALSPASAQTPDVTRALAEVDASDQSRMRGDSAAWKLVAPGFVFVHSTGPVDDLPAYLARRGRLGGAAGGRAVRTRDVEPPIAHIDGDVLVRVKLLGDSTTPTVRGGQSRVLDVYVQRDGAWKWLAHQTSEVRARWTPVVVAPALLDDYGGAYAAAEGPRRMYARRGDALVQVTPAGDRALIPLSDATFGYDGLNATVSFVRDKSGRVVAADESAQVGFTRFARVNP